MLSALALKMSAKKCSLLVSVEVLFVPILVPLTQLGFPCAHNGCLMVCKGRPHIWLGATWPYK